MNNLPKVKIGIFQLTEDKPLLSLTQTSMMQQTSMSALFVS